MCFNLLVGPIGKSLLFNCFFLFCEAGDNVFMSCGLKFSD